MLHYIAPWNDDRNQNYAYSNSKQRLGSVLIQAGAKPHWYGRCSNPDNFPEQFE